MTRGNQATSTTAEDPGAVKVLRYDEGRLANLASIAPAQGREFDRGTWTFIRHVRGCS